MAGNMSVAIWFAQGVLQLSIWAAGKTSKWKDFFKWILVLKITHELGSECNRDIAIHFTAETGGCCGGFFIKMWVQWTEFAQDVLCDIWSNITILFFICSPYEKLMQQHDPSLRFSVG